MTLPHSPPSWENDVLVILINTKVKNIIIHHAKHHDAIKPIHGNNHQVIQTNDLSMSKNNLIYVCSKIIRKSYNQTLSTNRSQKAYKHQVIEAFKSAHTNIHTKSKTTYIQQYIYKSYQKHTSMQTKRQSNHQSHRHMHNDHTNTHSINRTKY